MLFFFLTMCFLVLYLPESFAKASPSIDGLIQSVGLKMVNVK